jgi:hypothetical protein
VLLTVAGLLALTWKRRNATLGNLLLSAGAVSLQWSFSLLEGPGAKRLSSSLLSAQYGQSQFARLAYQEDRPLDLARQYEERCAAADSRSYTQPEPPGHALFDALAARLYRAPPVQSTSEWLANRAAFERREPFTAFAAFTTILFSLVSCLPVIVLARLGARLGSGGDATYYGLAFLLLPAINLVTMHLDQVLHPLCAALTLLSAVLAESTYGQTTREIGYLWIPLLVPAYLAVATEMGLLYKRRPTVFVLLSCSAILLRKNYHDFR